MTENMQSVFQGIVDSCEDCLDVREKFVLYSRNGYPDGKELTLEEVAKLMGGITRERVRQIECKSYKKISNDVRKNSILLNFSICFDEYSKEICRYLTNKEPIYDAPTYLTFDELEKEVSHELLYKVLAIFLCLTKNKARIKICRKYKIVYNSRGISESAASLKILGLDKDVISKEEVVDLDTISKQILLSNYRLSNGVYLKKGLIKRDTILSIVGDYFPDGYHISNKEHFEKFRTIYKDLYKIECSTSMREISSAMANDGSYCTIDRGTYRKFDKCSKMPQNLLDDIATYVLQDRGTIYYSTIFDAFSSQLNNIGIDNWFYFKGIFDIQCKGMFFTRKATLSVNSRKQFEDPIYDYISNSSTVVTMQELRNQFPGLKDYMFLFRIYGNLDIIALENGRFVHINNLNINMVDVTYLKQFVRAKIDESDFGIVSSRALYPLLKIENKGLCNNLGIANEQFGLFSILNYYLGDEFDFSRPFIGIKGTEELTLNKILLRYIKEFDLKKFSFSNIEEYTSKYNTYLINKIGFIEDVSDICLLVNDKEFINYEKIKIENIEQIKQFIIFTTKKFKEIKISHFRGYFFIPKNENIFWNKATIFSFINAFCTDELEIKMINSNYDTLDYIIRSVER